MMVAVVVAVIVTPAVVTMAVVRTPAVVTVTIMAVMPAAMTDILDHRGCAGASRRLDARHVAADRRSLCTGRGKAEAQRKGDCQNKITHSFLPS